MVRFAEISDKKLDIQDPLCCTALHSKASLPLSLCDLYNRCKTIYDFTYLVGSLYKSDNFGITYPEQSRTTGIFHDSQLALDLSHFQELSAIHTQGADIVVVSQVKLNISHIKYFCQY
jgi:hypothetical protein